MMTFQTTSTLQNNTLRHLIAQHPLLSYFLIAFGMVWLALLPFVLGRNGLGVFPFTLPEVAFILLFIGSTVLGPTGGAFVVTAAIDGRKGVRQLLHRYVQWRVGIQWYVLALFGYFPLYLVASWMAEGTAPLRLFVSNAPLILGAYPLALFSMVLFPALAEEPGWRGFALPRLQVTYGPLVGTLVLGLLHALWHLPVYTLVSGPAAMGPFDLTLVVANTVSIMAMSVVWTWVVNHSHGSILVAILLHAASNATGQVFGQFLPDLPPQIGTAWLILVLVTATLLILFTRGRLGLRTST